AALAQDTAPPSASDIREKIKSLSLEAVPDMLQRFKAGAKAPEDKAAAKDLERELATAKKIEPIATTKIPALVKAGKPRDAYFLAMATVDQYPGALALEELLRGVHDARDQAFRIVDDFDKSAITAGKVLEGGKGVGATKNAGEVEL